MLSNVRPGVVGCSAGRSCRHSPAAGNTTAHSMADRAGHGVAYKALHKVTDAGRTLQHTVYHTPEAAAETAGRIVGKESYEHPPGAHEQQHGTGEGPAPTASSPSSLSPHTSPKRGIGRALESVKEAGRVLKQAFYHMPETAAEVAGRMVGKDSYEHPQLHGRHDDSASPTHCSPVHRPAATSGTTVISSYRRSDDGKVSGTGIQENE